ncbi:SagB/ThcOx family dehydrogenase [Desulfomicrobium orale]|nr:SagB/ThcOx family dehydrogenase [Desulfomicrobium orale]
MIQTRNIYKSKFFVLDRNLKFYHSSCCISSEIYHENTKIFPYEMRPWLYLPKPSTLEYMSLKAFYERSSQSYKIYPSLPQISLHHEESQVQKTDLWEVMRTRRSERDYDAVSLPMQDISRLLFYAYGETGSLDTGSYIVRLRSIPSAGALYPLDIYVLACTVKSLESGLYHYNVRDHALEELKQGDFLQSIIPLIQNSNNFWLKQAGLILFVTATFRRNQMKYGERGYRGVLLDAGHLAQNIQLAATGLGLGACVLMGCMDDPVNDFLGVDGVEESVLYAISIGRPARQHQKNTEEDGGLS